MTGKTKVLPGFCGTEYNGGSNGTLLMWLPLWQSCLQKICPVGPAAPE
jgi:hypothetical protein